MAFSPQGPAGASGPVILHPVPSGCLCIQLYVTGPLKPKHLLFPLQKPKALQRCSHHPTQRKFLDMFRFKNGIAWSSDMYFILFDASPVFFWPKLYLFIACFVLTVSFLIPAFRSLCGQPIKCLKNSQILSDNFTKRFTQLEHI